jgi:hypothetical protein
VPDLLASVPDWTNRHPADSARHKTIPRNIAKLWTASMAHAARVRAAEMFCYSHVESILPGTYSRHLLETTLITLRSAERAFVPACHGHGMCLCAIHCCYAYACAMTGDEVALHCERDDAAECRRLVIAYAEHFGNHITSVVADRVHIIYNDRHVGCVRILDHDSLCRRAARRRRKRAAATRQQWAARDGMHSTE